MPVGFHPMFNGAQTYEYLQTVSSHFQKLLKITDLFVGNVIWTNAGNAERE
jgi:hypothetical protein